MSVKRGSTVQITLVLQHIIVHTQIMIIVILFLFFLIIFETLLSCTERNFSTVHVVIHRVY